MYIKFSEGSTESLKWASKVWLYLPNFTFINYANVEADRERELVGLNMKEGRGI